jgi:hypothetical protein
MTSPEKGTAQQGCDKVPETNAIFGKAECKASTEAVNLLGDKNTVAAANQARECAVPLAHGSDLLGKEDRFTDLLKDAKPADKSFDQTKALAADKTHDKGSEAVKTDMVTAIDRTATSGRGVRQEFANVHTESEQKKLAKVG